MKYVTTVQELFKSGTAKDEMVEAATRFGLDSKLAARLSIKNLSTVIAVLKQRFQSAFGFQIIPCRTTHCS